ncbi:MAG: hypothetical protein H6626_01805 [Pseudobdellovibrionaceae bacterium]|nr:hypothetical protein [Bdellovibrionales bacterium]USN47851.1 MAG: hypothetical protein H6626_01805 [Pseudobdellovibrionaceae bacterium]
MSEKKKHSKQFKIACSELEAALNQFKSLKSLSDRPDEQQRLEEMRTSLEQIKKQLDTLS